MNITWTWPENEMKPTLAEGHLCSCGEKASVWHTSLDWKRTLIFDCDECRAVRAGGWGSLRPHTSTVYRLL